MLRCKILGHSWGYSYDYKREEISTFNELPLLEHVRFCPVCKKREFGGWNEVTGEFIFLPSIAEIREIKLKKLGIK